MNDTVPGATHYPQLHGDALITQMSAGLLMSTTIPLVMDDISEAEIDAAVDALERQIERYGAVVFYGEPHAHDGGMSVGPGSRSHEERRGV